MSLQLWTDRLALMLQELQGLVQGLMPHARILLPFASLAMDGKPPQGAAVKKTIGSHDQDLQELFNEIDTNNEGYVNAHKLQVSVVHLCKNFACMVTCCLNMLAWITEGG